MFSAHAAVHCGYGKASVVKYFFILNARRGRGS